MQDRISSELGEKMKPGRLDHPESRLMGHLRLQLERRKGHETVVVDIT